MWIVKNFIKAILIIALCVGVVFAFHYITVKLALWVSTPNVLVTKSSLVQPSNRATTHEKVTGMLTNIIASKSNIVRKQWDNSKIDKVSMIIHSGYERTGLHPLTALAIISHESGFNNNVHHKNIKCDSNNKCWVDSVDYYLTQQNSKQAANRYYSVKNKVSRGKYKQEIVEILRPRVSGGYSHEKLRDPVLNIALMYQAVEECVQLHKRRGASENRMILCYNTPAYSVTARGSRLERIPYVREVLRHRESLKSIV